MSLKVVPISIQNNTIVVQDPLTSSRKNHDQFVWKCDRTVQSFQIIFIQSPFQSGITTLCGSQGNPTPPEMIGAGPSSPVSYKYTVIAAPSNNPSITLNLDPHIIVGDEGDVIDVVERSYLVAEIKNDAASAPEDMKDLFCKQWPNAQAALEALSSVIKNPIVVLSLRTAATIGSAAQEAFCPSQKPSHTQSSL